MTTVDQRSGSATLRDGDVAGIEITQDEIFVNRLRQVRGRACLGLELTDAAGYPKMGEVYAPLEEGLRREGSGSAIRVRGGNS